MRLALCDFNNCSLLRKPEHCQHGGDELGQVVRVARGNEVSGPRPPARLAKWREQVFFYHRAGVVSAITFS